MTNATEPQPQPDPQPSSHPEAQPAQAAPAASSAAPAPKAPPIGSGASWSVWLWVGGGLLLVAGLTSFLILAFDFFGKSASGTNARQPGETARNAHGPTVAASAPDPGLPDLRLSELPPEEKPPVADWQVLNRAQLRYCVAENLRLKTVFGLVRSDVPVDADIYTARLSDYKARCQNLSNDREEQKQMLKVIETDRVALEASARAEWASTQSRGPASNVSAAPARQPSSDAKDGKAKSAEADPGKPVQAVTGLVKPASVPVAPVMVPAKPAPVAPVVESAKPAPAAAAVESAKPDPVAPVTEPVKPHEEPAKPRPKPKPQAPQQFEWCVEGRCARL